MNVFVFVRDLVEGIARGFALFLTNRHNYIETVSIPRLDTTRTR